MSSNYPEGLSGKAYCIMEGCLGPNCSRCGEVNYQWLGWMGYVGRMAKKWGISKEAAEERICIEQAAKEEARIVDRIYLN